MAGISGTGSGASDAYTVYVRTPFGRDLFVACDDAGVIESRFVARRVRRATAEHATQSAMLASAVRQLEEYFSRRTGRFDVPLRLEGSAFATAVWRAVADLPAGSRASYADVARAIGRPNAHRAVATALAHTPLALFVPAHRVVGADGRVRGATPGSMRRRLLDFERRLPQR